VIDNGLRVELSADQGVELAVVVFRAERSEAPTQHIADARRELKAEQGTFEKYLS
jgi:hypothetical protein